MCVLLEGFKLRLLDALTFFEMADMAASKLATESTSPTVTASAPTKTRPSAAVAFKALTDVPRFSARCV